MAGFRAIAATGAALCGAIRAAVAAERDFGPSIAVDLAQAPDLQKAVGAGSPAKVTVYLYRVVLSSVRRHVGTDPRTGRRRRPPVPLDLHYLVTAWSAKPDTAQQLLGLIVRTLGVGAVLPASMLNAPRPSDAVFADGEDVELSLQALSWPDLSDVWEVAKANQQPSVTYIARMVQIDPEPDPPDGSEVLIRDLRYSTVVP